MTEKFAIGSFSSFQVFVMEEHDPQRHRVVNIGVLDNGSGMDAYALQSSLQFGGTERFGNRSGFGRFGMGLPNLSKGKQAESTQASASAGGRAVDTDRRAPGGDNPNKVSVTIAPAEITQFKTGIA